MTYPPPPPGPYGQQPPDPYQQGPNPYQQQPPWAAGPQGGFPMGPPPKKPRTGLIASLIIVAILVVGGGGVAAYFLVNKDDKNDSGQGGGTDGGPRAAAQTYVQELEKALNAGPKDADIGPLKPVTCGEDFSRMTDELEDAKDFQESNSASPDEVQVRIRMKDFKEESGSATFTMALQVVGNGDGADSQKMDVAKEGDDWKVCGLYKKDQEDGGGDENQPGGGPSGGSEPSSGEIPPNPIPTT